MGFDIETVKGNAQQLGTTRGSVSTDALAYKVIQDEAAHTVPNNENTAPAPIEQESIFSKIWNVIHPKKS